MRKIIRIFSSQSIKVSAIGSLSIKLLSAFFAFLSSVLLARILGAEWFGVYVLAFATVTLLSIPVALGLPLLITRYISKYEVEDNSAAIKGLLIKTNQIVLIAAVIVVFIAYFLYVIWWSSFDKLLIDAIWCSLILLPFLALGSLRAAALRGLRLVILGQLPDTLLRNFLLCIGISIYYFLDYKLTPAIAMFIHVIAAIISFAIGHVFLEIKLLKRLKKVKPIFFNKEWFKEAIPFSINSGVQVIKSKLITFVLVVFGNFQSVAIFDIAVRGASLVAFTLDALNLAIAPYISKAYEEKDIINLQKVVIKTSRLIFIFAFPVVIIFIIGGETFISLLFGEEFVLAFIPLIILCIGQLISAISGSVGLVLNMTGNQGYFTKIAIYMTIFNVIFSIPMVMYFDVKGAATLQSIILIMHNVLLVLYAKKKLKINTTIFS